MTATDTAPRVHINRPDTIALRRITHCPTCEQRRRFAAYEAFWYGATWTCLGCGDSWGEGERLERPFKPRWRQEAKARARVLWEQGVRCGSAEHMAFLDEQMGPYRQTEDIELPDTPPLERRSDMTDTCTHKVKARLLGRDARLYECIGQELNPRSQGCGALFVKGHTDRGEDPWIPVPNPLVCEHCLDGFGDFLLPTYTQYPDVCEKCGTPCQRTATTDKAAV